MSDETNNLELPYILPAQAQKHVTHNEALQRLDAIVQLTIADMLGEPPEDPGEGQCFGVAEDATGEWSGRDGKLACWQDGAWNFITPKPGWLAFDHSAGHVKSFDDGAWQDFPLPLTASFEKLGINATADDYNRLSLSAHASLLTHAGNGHQLKINKQSTGDTASLLFQTDWQGRAEFGTAGEDRFSIKVSADGISWATAFVASPGGIVDLPNRPLTRASRTAAAVTPADGSQTGFQSLSVAQGGFALGAAVPSGTGNRLDIPADGLYLICLNLAVNSSTSHEARVLKNGSTTLARIAGHNSGGPRCHQSVTAIVELAAGDWLCLEHSGDAEIEFGPGYTELSLIRL